MSRPMPYQGGLAVTARGNTFILTYDVNLHERHEVIRSIHDSWLSKGLITWEEYDCLLDLLSDDYPFTTDDDE